MHACIACIACIHESYDINKSIDRSAASCESTMRYVIYQCSIIKTILLIIWLFKLKFEILNNMR